VLQPFDQDWRFDEQPEKLGPKSNP